MTIDYAEVRAIPLGSVIRSEYGPQQIVDDKPGEQPLGGLRRRVLILRPVGGGLNDEWEKPYHPRTKIEVLVWGVRSVS